MLVATGQDMNTEQQISQGAIFPTRHWGNIEIINCDIKSKILIKFFNTGNTKTTRASYITTGDLADSVAAAAGIKRSNFNFSNVKGAGALTVGSIYPSNSYGGMEVVSDMGSKNVIVKFIDSSNILKTSRASVVRGMVADILRKEEKEAAKKKEIELKKQLKQDTIKNIKEAKEELIAAKLEIRQIKKLIRKTEIETAKVLKHALDSNGVLFLGEKFSDNLGFEFIVVDRVGFEVNIWTIKYIISGNEYNRKESHIRSGIGGDTLNLDWVECKKYNMKIAAAGYYKNNRSKMLEQASNYQKQNIEKTRTRNRNRRARKLNAEGTHTKEETDLLYIQQNGKCACCSGSMEGKRNKHLDHIMPLTLGGTNFIENLQWLCQFCNISKSDMHPDKWSEYIATRKYL